MIRPAAAVGSPSTNPTQRPASARPANGGGWRLRRGGARSDQTVKLALNPGPGGADNLGVPGIVAFRPALENRLKGLP